MDSNGVALQNVGELASQLHFGTVSDTGLVTDGEGMGKVRALGGEDLATDQTWINTGFRPGVPARVP